MSYSYVAKTRNYTKVWAQTFMALLNIENVVRVVFFSVFFFQVKLIAFLSLLADHQNLYENTLHLFNCSKADSKLKKIPSMQRVMSGYTHVL